MRKKPTRKRPYFKMESAMTAMLRDASGKMHHGILFDPPLACAEASQNSKFLFAVRKRFRGFCFRCFDWSFT